MPSSFHGGAATSAGSCLDAIEQELTQAVPSLLEAMNRTSTEVNLIERQLGESQERYQKLLEQWSSLYEDLRAQHGSSIDRVRPYFEASQALNAACRRVQGAVREFSAAASLHAQAKVELKQIEEDLAYGAHKVRLDGDQQDDLSRATVRVLKCQQDRDRKEQEYARALRDYQEAQENVDSWRAQIGDTIIKRTLPSFRRLQKQHVTLASEQSRISTLTERASHAKSVYQNSMRELDRINLAVHAARHDFQAVERQERASIPEESPEAEESSLQVPHQGLRDEQCVSRGAKLSHDAARDAEIVKFPCKEVAIQDESVVKIGGQTPPELSPEICHSGPGW